MGVASNAATQQSISKSNMLSSRSKRAPVQSEVLSAQSSILVPVSALPSDNSKPLMATEVRHGTATDKTIKNVLSKSRDVSLSKQKLGATCAAAAVSSNQAMTEVSNKKSSQNFLLDIDKLV